uniref:Nuclear receptor domain-containing protein n=1 Tax=Strongyloides stercoralis TaxID=6248 RepID=A0A0K0E891_STRER
MPTNIYQNNLLEQKKISNKPLSCTICSSPEVPSKHFGCYSCTAYLKNNNNYILFFLIFRRSVVLQIDFKCLYDNICNVNYNIKNVCKSCRFNRCLLMGMRRDKVQKPRGRYLKRECYMDEFSGSKSDSSSLSFTSTPILPKNNSNNNNSNKNLAIDDEYTSESFVNQLIFMEQMTEKRRKILTGCNPLTILRDPIEEYQIDKSYKMVPFNFKQFNECIRGVCLLSFDYLTSMPFYNLFNEEDKYILFRGVFFLTCILDSSYFTYKTGLYKQGYYAGIEGMISSIYDDNYGWETEGNITREMKLALLKPIYKNIFESLILPMSNLEMKPWEFATFKGMAIWSVCCQDLTIEGKQIGKKIENLIINGLSQKYNNNDEVSLRLGQIILLMTNLHVIVKSIVEFFTRIDIFNLIELDNVIKDLLNRKFLYDIDK